MKSIYLLGGNGAPNFGDEVIAKAWMDFLSQKFPQARITLDCNSLRTPGAFFELDGTRITNIDGIKIFTNNVMRDKFADIKNLSDRFLASVKFGLDFFSVENIASIRQSATRSTRSRVRRASTSSAGDRSIRVSGRIPVS